MALNAPAAVLAAVRYGYKRYGLKGAVAFGGGVAGLFYLWRRRRTTAE